MNQIQQFLLFIVLFICISCTNKKESGIEHTILTKYPIQFSTDQSIQASKRISVNTKMFASPKGDTIIVLASINNRTKDSLRLAHTEWQIRASNNIRSEVAWCDYDKCIIPPKSNTTLKFLYVPINNIALHKRTNLYGDMDSTYCLDMGLYRNNTTEAFLTEQLFFYLEPGLYQKYKSEYGKNERIRLYQIKNELEIKNNLISQLNKINSSPKKKYISNNVEINHCSLLINGSSIDFNFYSIDSTLYLNYKCINHGREILIIKPYQLAIKVDNELWLPEILTINNKENTNKAESMTIKRGDRLNLTLKYANINTSFFELEVNDFSYYNTNRTLFPENLRFERDTIIILQ